MKRITILLTVSLFTILCSAQSYKGFIEAGKTFFVEDTKTPYGKYENSELHTTDLMTTHGLQFNQLFVGMGAGVRLGDCFFGLPIYANARYSFTSKKVSPFADAKVGYAFCDAKGFYAYPSVGVNWNCYKTLSIFLKAGYTYNQTKDLDINMNGVTVMAGFSF
ncbi:hypothetical protein [Phocaeicola sartorii]|uniref:hypothetical protein n=1 Tax=Phocaeicola sartorii TaxID=671267 RepID=UPI0035140039